MADAGYRVRSAGGAQSDDPGRRCERSVGEVQSGDPGRRCWEPGRDRRCLGERKDRGVRNKHG